MYYIISHQWNGLYLRDGSCCDLLPKIKNVCFPRRPPNPPPLSDCVLGKKEKKKKRWWCCWDFSSIVRWQLHPTPPSPKRHLLHGLEMPTQRTPPLPPSYSPLSLHVGLHTQKLINWTFNSVKRLATKTPKVQLPATQREITLKLWLTRMSFCGNRKKKEKGGFNVRCRHTFKSEPFTACNSLMDLFSFLFFLLKRQLFKKK